MFKSPNPGTFTDDLSATIEARLALSAPSKVGGACCNCSFIFCISGVIALKGVLAALPLPSA